MYHIKKIFLKFLLFLKTFLAKYAKKVEQTTCFKDSSSKSFVSEAAELQIKSETQKLQKEVEEICLKIIKKYFGDVDKTVKFLEKKGINVYRTKFATKLLTCINETQGFILPQKGYKAFYLNFWLGILCSNKLIFSTKTNNMFIFSAAKIDTYFLASQVYKFVAYKKKMPGYEYSIQEKFKRIYKNPTIKNFDKLTTGDIFALREAIARDVEAADFAIKLHKETELLNKISNSKNQTDK